GENPLYQHQKTPRRNHTPASRSPFKSGHVVRPFDIAPPVRTNQTRRRTGRHRARPRTPPPKQPTAGLHYTQNITTPRRRLLTQPHTQPPQNRNTTPPITPPVNLLRETNTNPEENPGRNTTTLHHPNRHNNAGQHLQPISITAVISIMKRLGFSGMENELLRPS
ncbi:hypothetical protein Droror1_Dr00028200, partial [Drosera rotundifolia]